MSKYFSVMLVTVFVFGSVCSMGMAMPDSSEPDVSVLFYGAPREMVLEQMGNPETSTKNESGEMVDAWDIVTDRVGTHHQGLFHDTLDMATFGVWRRVTTGWWRGLAEPASMDVGREEHARYIVTYDQNSTIKEITVDYAGVEDRMLVL